MPRPAALLFRLRGCAATGVNQILETGDVKAGSLYHHFPNGKAELAVAAVESAGGGIEKLLRRLLASGTPVPDLVDQWIDVLAAQLAEDPRDGCPVAPGAVDFWLTHISGAIGQFVMPLRTIPTARN